MSDKSQYLKMVDAINPFGIRMASKAKNELLENI
jgi:hypothetical protein